MTSNMQDFAFTLDVLARTLWGEARGEGVDGMKAVACVIVNRVEKKGWMGKSIAEVCLKPYQFSCWLESDPNRAKLLAVDATDRAFKQAIEVATDAVNGRLTDYTFNSTHYHTLEVAPKWAKGKTPVVLIGNHAFYNDIE